MKVLNIFPLHVKSNAYFVPLIICIVSLQSDEVQKGIVCQDNKTVCPQDYTCCALKGGYGCCPLKKVIKVYHLMC